MARDEIDILMITYNRPEYTQLALSRLLETCDERMRVWLWHNGDDEPTLAVVEALRDHPCVHRFHHSRENVRLREPTNWAWSESDGDYVCKVDDDCMMPPGWADTLRDAHRQNPAFGVIGCWRFFPEDFVPELAEKKIKTFAGGHQLMQNFWVEGSGFLMKRQCVRQGGKLQDGQSFPSYCTALAKNGWINGWYYPFLFQEHMDDPRSEHSLLKTDKDLKQYLPLSAQMNGVETLEAWQAQLRRSARRVQEASIDPADYRGWRALRSKVRRRVRKLLGVKSKW